MSYPIKKNALSKSAPLSKGSIRNEWAIWLAKYNWQWFCTFTFKNPPHPESANKKFRLWINRLNRGLYGCRAQKKGQSVYWVLALEYHKSGVIHFHALLSNEVDLNETCSRFEAMERWEKIAGIARIYPIDEHLEKVTSYVSKYVLKGGEISFSDNLADFRATQLGLAT
jgi:hypothetical protein